MSWKVILVDDERPALDVLRDTLLDESTDFQFFTYTRSEEALNQLYEIQPDLVFLDIEMPGLSGMEVARKWRQNELDFYLVFVSAYEKYSLDAFQVGAEDYLLKPIEPERLRETLLRFSRRFTHRDKPLDFYSTTNQITSSIRCFGPFEVRGPLGVVVWNTQKTEELFAYLVMHRNVRMEQLFEDLFAEFQYERARNYIRNCMFHIRRALKKAGLERSVQVQYVNRSYLLDWDEATVYCDVQQFKETTDTKERAELYNGELFANLSGLWRHAQVAYYERLALEAIRCCLESAEQAEDSSLARHYQAKLARF
jgi:two-component system LytT family response regulator